MKRVVLLLAAVLFLASVANVSAASTVEKSGDKAGCGKPQSGILCLSVGKYKLEARALMGYEHLNMDFNVASPLSRELGVELYEPPSPLKAELEAGDFWIGGLDTELTVNKNYGIFLNGETVIPKGVGMDTPSEPFWGGESSVHWQGSGLQWYSLETGIDYHFRPQVSFLGGVRWSPFSLDLGNPVDGYGLIPYFHQTYGDVYTANMQTDLFIPYVGVRLEPYKLIRLPLTLTILYSPLAYASVSQDFAYKYLDTSDGSPIIYNEHENYSMSDVGNFVEAVLEYDTTISPGVGLGLWVRGDFLRVTGTADQNYTQTGNTFNGVIGARALGSGSLNETAITVGGTVSF
ncbi:MAG: hypothetical protein M0Z81_10600 [Deltaproteobacteria bacterium]|jgi:hypothetical protein|nr:hypothetical protein [Deltaproteobacteria bacterium]